MHRRRGRGRHEPPHPPRGRWQGRVSGQERQRRKHRGTIACDERPHRAGATTTQLQRLLDLAGRELTRWRVASMLGRAQDLARAQLRVGELWRRGAARGHQHNYTQGE